MNTYKKPMLERVWVVCGLAVLCNALWGSAFPSIKIGYRLFEIPGRQPASQILFAGMRFAWQDCWLWGLEVSFRERC